MLSDQKSIGTNFNIQGVFPWDLLPGAWCLGLGTWCFGFWIILTPSLLYSQKLNPDGTIDCTNPTHLVIRKDTIMMESSGDYEKFEPSPTPLVFYRESDKYTFWYKLSIEDPCELLFEIISQNPSDNYDFFLYKNTEPNFCLGLIRKTIIPIRANLFRNPSTGQITGLSPDSPLKEDTAMYRKYNYLYSNAFHTPVPVKKGEEYYLNVFHTRGEDCGHFLSVTAGSHSVNIQAIHKNCFIPYADEMQLEALKKAEDKNPPPEFIVPKEAILNTGEPVPVVKKTVEETITITGTVFDSKKMKPLNAEVRITDKSGKPVPVNYSPATGVYEATVSKGSDYRVTVSAVGYKEEIVPVEKVSAPVPVKITMNPVRAGEKFVMDKIYFHPNTYAFRKEAYPELDKLLDYLLRNDDVRIEIAGHTNGNHSIKKEKAYAHLGQEWNFQGSAKQLSRMRSEAVKKYLIKKGVSPERLKTSGYGGDQPVVAKARTMQEALKNIRVEIMVVE
ncbi:MAG: OmpA family protein [Bacteroidetes bacterium]|nr:OmpA family protein [Bacteroidota bacterium]